MTRGCCCEGGENTASPASDTSAILNVANPRFLVENVRVRTTITSVGLIMSYDTSKAVGFKYPVQKVSWNAR